MRCRPHPGELAGHRGWWRNVAYVTSDSVAWRCASRWSLAAVLGHSWSGWRRYGTIQPSSTPRVMGSQNLKGCFKYKSDVKRRNTLGCVDHYTCRGLRLWNSRRRGRVLIIYVRAEDEGHETTRSLKHSRYSWLSGGNVVVMYFL